MGGGAFIHFGFYTAAADNAVDDDDAEEMKTKIQFRSYIQSLNHQEMYIQ